MLKLILDLIWVSMRSDEVEIHRSVESQFELKSVDLRKSAESQFDAKWWIWFSCEIRRSANLRICSLSWIWPVLAEFGCNFSPKMYPLWVGVEYELYLAVNRINRYKSVQTTLSFVNKSYKSMYDMGAWQFKIGKTTGFHRMIRRMMVSLIYYLWSKMVR